LILRKEEFESMKTLKTVKRRDHTNPSVGIDGINDYQATVAKSIIPECSCFNFCGEQTPTAFMTCCSNLNAKS
jgi:hypothetical protein